MTDLTEVRLKVESGSVEGLPVALIEQGGVAHLARLDASGNAFFTVQQVAGARLTVPKAVPITIRSGAADEALVVPWPERFVAAAHGDAGTMSAQLPGRQTVTVTERRNRATGRLYTVLVAMSDAKADADSLLLVNLAGQLLAVPLIWRAAQRRASGALRLGPPSDRFTLAVVPELVRAPALLDADMLARSMEKAADPDTREALRKLLDQR